MTAIPINYAAQARKDMERQLRWTTIRSLAKRGLLVGLIAGIFALSKPILLMAALGSSCMVFACLALRRPIHLIGIAVLVNFGCWISSGLISGGMATEMLTTKAYWRGEGRVFLFYLPLLLCSVISLKQSDLRFVVKLACTLTIIGLVLVAAWFAGLGHYFQPHIDESTGEVGSSHYFVGLLTSHTGAGAFWGTMTAFLAAFSLKSGHRSTQTLAIVAAMLTLATGGRAATLGLIAMVGWLLIQGQILNRKTLIWAVPVCGVIGIGGWGVMVAAPEIGERMTEVFQADTLNAIISAADEPTLENAAGHFHSGANLENHNIVIRVFLWKYALRLFKKSPILGIGYGRFNDADLQFSGIPGVINFAVDGYRFDGCGIEWDEGQLMISAGNAHNSYLHLLAELGIIGFALTMYLWWMMFRQCQPSATTDPFSEAYCAGCQAAIVCLMTASLFGHALGAPSGGILLTALAGAWIASNKI